MTNRHSWKFTYSSQDLLAAVNKIIEHAEERLVHWTGRYEQAKHDAVSQTVQVKVVTHAVTGGERASLQADFDKTAQEELNLAQQKMDWHRGRIEEFDRWRRGFTANNDHLFELDPEDIAYFEL